MPYGLHTVPVGVKSCDADTKAKEASVHVTIGSHAGGFILPARTAFPRCRTCVRKKLESQRIREALHCTTRCGTCGSHGDKGVAEQ